MLFRQEVEVKQCLSLIPVDVCIYSTCRFFPVFFSFFFSLPLSNYHDVVVDNIQRRELVNVYGV